MTTPTQDVTATLLLNPTTCDGRGLCHHAAPDLIELDEWGYPIIDPAPVHGPERQHAKRAVNACPRLALALVHQR